MFEKLFTQEQLKTRIAELGKEVSAKFRGEEVTFICILKGSMIFCSDLMREMTVPLEVDFITASSYEGTNSTGEVNIKFEFTKSLKGKNILVVEDIVDTGLTIKETMAALKKLEPKTLGLVSLLSKPSRREHEVAIDYLGFEIEDHFVIGYGLDLDQKYRELPYIGLYKS